MSALARPIIPKRVSARTIGKLIKFFQQQVDQTGEHELSATYKDIAAGSNISYAIIKEALLDLQDQGLLEIREVGGRRTANVYTYLGTLDTGGQTTAAAAAGPDRRHEILERRLAQVQAMNEQLKTELAQYRDFAQRMQTIVDSGRHYVVIVRKDRDGELGLRPSS